MDVVSIMPCKLSVVHIMLPAEHITKRKRWHPLRVRDREPEQGCRRACRSDSNRNFAALCCTLSTLFVIALPYMPLNPAGSGGDGSHSDHFGSGADGQPCTSPLQPLASVNRRKKRRRNADPVQPKDQLKAFGQRAAAIWKQVRSCAASCICHTQVSRAWDTVPSP